MEGFLELGHRGGVEELVEGLLGGPVDEVIQHSFLLLVGVDILGLGRGGKAVGNALGKECGHTGKLYACNGGKFSSLCMIFFCIGGISGIESLVRNVAYMVMISRMVNVVGEQGTYWVANNFIWGWLLLPVLQLGELIKQEVAVDKENVRKNSLGYFGITVLIAALWFVSVPLWNPFMTHVLQFADVDKLFRLVLVLVGFYVLYAFQNVFDSIFYGLGKTNYMLFESVVTNTIYYGIAFILYATNVWTPTLTGIALLFGIGNAFDSVVSLVAYAFLLRKEKINVLKVE